MQTYIRLRDSGYPCELVYKFPESGILVAHRASLPFAFEPNPELLIVAIKADYDWHPYAQVQIVQNERETGERWNSHFIPLWTQLGLIPRQASRADRFENIRYYGISYNLATEMKEPQWQEDLAKLGLHWALASQPAWHDYSETDAVIAVRDFSTSAIHHHKPASKLFNAWQAHVPVILGAESAYRAERRSPLDYIEVTNYAEAIAAVKRLRDNTNLRQAMIQNGVRRGLEMSVGAITARWISFLNKVAIPAYEAWRSQPRWQQDAFLLARHARMKKSGALKRIQKKLGQQD